MQNRQPLMDTSSESVSLIGAGGCVATLGFFDGVHRGHRFLIDRLKELSGEKSLPSLVLSFWPHPHIVLGKPCPPLLADCEEKCSLIRDCGIDYMQIIPFTVDLSQLSAYDFMEKVLRDVYNVKCLLMGYDHRFGKRGSKAESFEDYRHYGEQLGMEVLQAKALMTDIEHPIGSSAIREALLHHEIEKANDALGYGYSISGKVTKGFENGHMLGFPTANVLPYDQCKLIPSDGVYAVEVVLANGERYPGMLNIGCRPTLHNGDAKTIEVNIIDFDKDLYGQDIRLIFRHYLREERTFSSIGQLIEQLKADESAVRRLTEL